MGLESTRPDQNRGRMRMGHRMTVHCNARLRAASRSASGQRGGGGLLPVLDTTLKRPSGLPRFSAPRAGFFVGLGLILRFG